MPALPHLCIHVLLDVLLHLLPHYGLSHFLNSQSLSNNNPSRLSFSLKHIFPSLIIHNPSTSLLLIFNLHNCLNIPFGQFFKCPSALISSHCPHLFIHLITLETAFCCFIYNAFIPVFIHLRIIHVHSLVNHS